MAPVCEDAARLPLSLLPDLIAAILHPFFINEEAWNNSLSGSPILLYKAALSRNPFPDQNARPYIAARLPPNLLGIAHRPHRIELQPLGNRTFQYKYRSCPGTGYQIDTLRMQVRYRLAEHTVMPRVHQPDAIGTYQGSSVLIYRFQNTVFQKRTLMCLLSKSGRKNDDARTCFRQPIPPLHSGTSLPVWQGSPGPYPEYLLHRHKRQLPAPPSLWD